MLQRVSGLPTSPTDALSELHLLSGTPNVPAPARRAGRLLYHQPSGAPAHTASLFGATNVIESSQSGELLAFGSSSVLPGVVKGLK